MREIKKHGDLADYEAALEFIVEEYMCNVVKYPEKTKAHTIGILNWSGSNRPDPITLKAMVNVLIREWGLK